MQLVIPFGYSKKINHSHIAEAILNTLGVGARVSYPKKSITIEITKDAKTNVENIHKISKTILS